MISDFAFVADWANKTDNGKINAIGIFSRMMPASYPTPVNPVWFVARIHMPIEFSGTSRQFAVSWQDSEGNNLVSGAFDATINNFELDRTDAEIFTPTPPVFITAPGEYFVVLNSGEQELARTSVVFNPAESQAGGNGSN